MKNKILIISGDPESINSEIIFKSWKKLSKQIKKNIYIIGNQKLLQDQFKTLRYKISLEKVQNVGANIKSNKLKVIDVKLSYKNPFKINRKALKNYIKKSFDLAHTITTKNQSFKGIINCPIKKDLLKNKNTGVTELLAAKCLIKDNSEVMVIRNNKLSVALITTHNNLKDVPKKINQKLIKSKIESINLHFKKIFSKKPKIAVLGLNPHNAELTNNSEEKRIIIPAIKNLKNKNIKVFGPLVSDTIFINEYKKFDVIVGMYHDQVLGPFKALFKFNAINLTIGLPYLRVSPDHGVALNLVKKNKASADSLFECIKFINKYG